MKVATLLATVLLMLPGMTAAAPLFQPWIDGAHGAEPQMQVQRYDADTYVIRQSVKTNFEAPFLYLLFGKEKALLLDTGAGGLQIRPTIDGVIAEWLKAHHRTSIPLVVAHSHSHGDHRSGDGEFRDRPDTQVVGWTAPDVAAFFKVADWPHDVVKFDLGGRVLDVIPTPGHHPSHIMIFDEKTHLLLSGDTLYPGRLYVPADQFDAYRESIDRVVAFTRTHKVSHILGAHVEMTTTPGKDFAMSAPTHPDEHVLQLPYADLLKLQAQVHGMDQAPVKDVQDDFIVYPLKSQPPPKPAG